MIASKVTKGMLLTTAMILVFSCVHADVISDPKANLVAYYPFNGNANDQSGNGNHGAVFGDAALAADKDGNANRAYRFTGSGDGIWLKRSISLNLANFSRGYTIAAWIKPERSSSEYQNIIAKQFSRPGFPPDMHAAFFLRLHKNRIEAGHTNPDGTGVVFTGSRALSNNTWYHVAVTWKNSTPNAWTVYVNAKKDPGSGGMAKGLFSGGTDGGAAIGHLRLHESIKWTFNGTIDEVRIYKSALSQAQIEQIMSKSDSDGDGVSNQVDNCPDEYNPASADCPPCMDAIKNIQTAISDYYSDSAHTSPPAYSDLQALGFYPPEGVVLTYHVEGTHPGEKYIIEAYRSWGGWVYSLEGPIGSPINIFWYDEKGNTYKTGQPDYDMDGIGDVCDRGIIDTDGDGYPDANDNCPFQDNDQSDYDGDKIGDPCDPDADNDGALKSLNYEGDDCDDLNERIHPDPEKCTAPEPDCPCKSDFSYAGGPGNGDCNPNSSDCDGDGVKEKDDNCPGMSANNGLVLYNAGDSLDNCAETSLGISPGDLWQRDYDCDGKGDPCDNCPNFANEDQEYPKWYKDQDGDWYSDGTFEAECAPSAEYYKISTDANWKALTGDCNDSDASVHPGAADVRKDCDPATGLAEEYTIEVDLQKYDAGSWVPIAYGSWDSKDGDKIKATFKAMSSGVQLTTDPSSYPHLKSDFNLSLETVPVGTDNPTKHPGKYVNGPDQIFSPDFDAPSFTTNQVELTCRDYGGSIIIRATVTIVKAPGDEEIISKAFYFPKDSDQDGIADFYENPYGNLDPLADNDNDGLNNLKEYRGFMWGKTVKVGPNNIYDTVAYKPEGPWQGTVKHFRTDPGHRDLFVIYEGFSAKHPFAVGEAFQLLASPVDIYAVSDNLAKGLATYNIDVATVTLVNGVLGLENPHIDRWTTRSWTFSTLGKSIFGGDVTYGAYCRVFKKSMDAIFLDKPHHDYTTYIGTRRPHFSRQEYWVGPNKEVDAINRVEDQNDNGVDDGEDATGNLLIDGDHPVRNIPSSEVYLPGNPKYIRPYPGPDIDGDGKDDEWDFQFELSPFNVDNDSGPVEVELPLVGSASDYIDPLYENTLEQVIKMIVTHELGHNVGITVHTSNSSCAMHGTTNNFVRDDFFSSTAEALVRIHNTPYQP